MNLLSLKNLIFSLILVVSSTVLATEGRSSYIERTGTLLNLEERVSSKIDNAHRILRDFGVIGLTDTNYPCADIGETMLAIDVALHIDLKVESVVRYIKQTDGTTKVITEEVNLDDLYSKLEKAKKQICRIEVRLNKGNK